MKTITAYIGVNNSGKTYQANLLRERKASDGIIKYSYADGVLLIAPSDGVREMVYNILGIEFPLSKQDYEKFKTEEFYIAGTHVNGRDLLINTGMYMRSIDEDYWVKDLQNNIYRDLPNNVVIDDLRFTNELDHLMGFAGAHGYKLELIYCDYNDVSRKTKPNPTNKLALNLVKFKHLADITDYMNNFI